MAWARKIIERGIGRHRRRCSEGVQHQAPTKRGPVGQGNGEKPQGHTAEAQPSMMGEDAEEV